MTDWQSLYRKWHGITLEMREIALKGADFPLPKYDHPQAQATFRSQVARAVCHFYGLKLAYALANPRSRAVICYILRHHVGMSSLQAGAFVHVSKAQACRLIRKASKRYPQDIHSILTTLGWGDGGHREG